MSGSFRMSQLIGYWVYTTIALGFSCAKLMEWINKLTRPKVDVLVQGKNKSGGIRQNWDWDPIVEMFYSSWNLGSLSPGTTKCSTPSSVITTKWITPPLTLSLPIARAKAGEDKEKKQSSISLPTLSRILCFPEFSFIILCTISSELNTILTAHVWFEFSVCVAVDIGAAGTTDSKGLTYQHSSHWNRIYLNKDKIR